MTRRDGSRAWRLLRATLLTAAVGTSVSACTEVVPPEPEVHEPAHLEPVEGTDVQQVTFDERGAEQVSVQTARVRRVGGHAVVPYAALIYDGAGSPWVYTSPEPRTYVREPVDVRRVVGHRVVLDDGPSAGTEVVTTGAAEVYGAELDIAGSH